mgnify:CR=1 FL=1
MVQLSNEDALLVKKALEKELAYETTFLISTSQGRILLEEGDFAKRLLARDELIRVLGVIERGIRSESI